MLPYITSLLLLATGVCAQNYNNVNLGNIPTPRKSMVVIYPNAIRLDNGNEIYPASYNNEPYTSYNANSSALYAVAGLVLHTYNNELCPTDQTLLSLKVNILGNETDETGEYVAQYVPPVVTEDNTILYLTLLQNGPIEPGLLGSLSDALTAGAGRECYNIVNNFMQENNIKSVYAGNFGIAKAP